MSQITADMIKELREISGVGIGKCKEALEASGGNLDSAIEWLRKAGMATAIKKEGRATNEGKIGFAENKDRVALVEINAETDFVVNNDRFQDFVSTISEEIAATNPASLEAFLAQKFSKQPDITIDEFRAGFVQTIGENIQIKRLKTFEKGNHTVGVYSHLGGKIVTVVEIDGAQGEEALAKDIAMHVAAAHPEYVKPEDVPGEVIEKEKEIFKTQIKNKPDHIVEKIVDGKINAFFNEICLNKQNYIKDDSMTVEELVAKRGKETSKPLNIARFTRWTVG